MTPEEKKVYDKAYRQKNKEKISAKKKAYRQKNKEKLATQYKAYYDANVENVKAKAVRWQKANPEKAREACAKRKAENKALVEDYAKVTGQDKCLHCGSKDQLEWDHIDPSTKLFMVSNYGRKKDALLEEVKKCQRLCRACHIQKGKDNGDNIPSTK